MHGLRTSFSFNLQEHVRVLSLSLQKLWDIESRWASSSYSAYVHLCQAVAWQKNSLVSVDVSIEQSRQTAKQESAVVTLHENHHQTSILVSLHQNP